MSTYAQQFTASNHVHERRDIPRILPKSLVYVACGEANGGMVLNLSEEGLAISMAIAVGDESYSNLNVRMNGLPESIELRGRMVWTTKSKKRAGIHLLGLTDHQREQVRRWIQLEAVRDVNLVPREVTEAEETPSQAITSSAVDPTVVAEPRSSLLDAFGGTPPESLGPPLPERFASEQVTHPSEPSQGFDSVNVTGFRENEWDLAAVTMLPRKKPKPEGLSAFALMLLWIAIPSFGIGILVGRRPLEQWLSRGDAIGKNIARFPKTLAGSGETREQPLAGVIPRPARVETTQVPAPSRMEPPAFTDAAGSIVDASLLNSMSTQEKRALKNSNTIDTTRGLSAQQLSNLSVKPNPAASFGRPESAALKTISAPAETASSTSRLQNSSSEQTREPDTKNVAKFTTPAVVGHSAEGSIGPLTPNLTPTQQNSVALVPASTTSTSTQPANPPPMNAPPSASAATSLSVSDTSRNSSVFNQPKTSQAPSSGSNAAPSSIVSPGVAPSNASPSNSVSNRPSMSASSAPARPIAAGTSSPLLAAVSTQPPLHGVMLVARKNEESFLLKLPMESLPSGNSTSVRIQRFVMVPRESRWHGHGPIAKVAVGELLSKGEPDKADAAVKPHAGDSVTVRAFVDKNGSVEDLKPISGRFALMPRVMHSVRDWQFDQTLIDGKAVESEVDVTVEFRAP